MTAEEIATELHRLVNLLDKQKEEFPANSNERRVGEFVIMAATIFGQLAIDVNRLATAVEKIEEKGILVVEE